MAKELFSRKKNEEVNAKNETVPVENESEAFGQNGAEGHINEASEKEVMISAEEYRRLKELEKKSLSAQDNEAETDSAEDSTTIITQWERDAAQLKFIQPDFDFRTELQSNPQFRQLISNGMGVIEAYASSRPEPKREEPPKQAERKPIQQNAQTPDSGTGTNTRNPAKMSSAEFKQYIDSIRNS